MWGSLYALGHCPWQAVSPAALEGGTSGSVMWTGPRSAGAGWSPGLARCPGRAGALPKVPGARGPQAGMLCPLPVAWASKDSGLWGVGFRAPRPLSSCHRPHTAPEQPMQHTAGLLPSCSSPSSGAWLTLGPPESPDRIRRAGPPAGSSRGGGQRPQCCRWPWGPSSESPAGPHAPYDPGAEPHPAWGLLGLRPPPQPPFACPSVRPSFLPPVHPPTAPCSRPSPAGA